MPQEHNNETDELFILDLLPVLRDERYVRINGRPLLLSRTELLPDLARAALVWREVASKIGIDPLPLTRGKLCARGPGEYQLRRVVRVFAEHLGNYSGDASKMSFVRDGFEGNLYDYREFVKFMLHRPDAGY
jgi:hypothetical protein